MSNALLSYQFEENPVRVVMIAGDPWFVATDLARALAYRDAANMARNLDDDEKGTHIVSTLGGNQDVTVISESGMYAAIFNSRKPEARRFRKWVTSEVLPELRRTGKYQLHDFDPPPQIASDLDVPRMQAGVAIVREARRLFGPAAARNMWARVGLPEVIAESAGDFTGDPIADPLKVWLADKAETSINQAAEGIGLRDIDHSTRYRIGELMRMWGWTARNRKVGHRTVRIFSRPVSSIAGETA